MSNYRSALVVFVSVIALTLLGFFIALFNHKNTASVDASTAINSAWIILLAGISLASVLAGYLVSSTRQGLAQEQLRSDRDKLENILVSAHKLEIMAQLVGSTAHDFNNILMTISGYASLALAKNEGKNDSEMHEYLSLVSLSADRATSLIRQLLSFSRAKSQKRSSIELVPAVQDNLSLLDQVLPERINVQVDIAEHLPVLKIDSLALEQIIINLVVNARDAIEGGGTINISLAPKAVTDTFCNACHKNFTGEFVCLTVSDNGKGLTLENADDIFQPFYTTKTDGKSAGLGLALLQNLVHTNGGHIELASEPGKGTVVTIFLPLPAPVADKGQK